MCGIAGWLGVVPDAAEQAHSLVAQLRHRGPDSSGVRVWPRAALVHTRLSIIDLSESGAQPMSNEDGTISVVFNGEIYNHRDLRSDLEKKGHAFRGHSDTEVLPHLYEERGLEFVSDLRGMFSIALYDSRRNRLVLARDRFGVKPLFYAPGASRVAFASEITALLAMPGVDDRPDPQAVFDFAALFYVPAPETFYAGIRALQAGEMLIAAAEGEMVRAETRTWHRWAIAPDPALDLEQAADRAGELVQSAVGQQLQSDVPLGCLLSGGIDSSLVSAAAQTAVGDLRTFNVRFADADYDETWAALEVSRHIGSNHQVLDMPDRSGTWEEVTRLLEHAGQPFADPSLFAVNAVSKLMREHVTVALSGDGGDEGFGGYNYYRWITDIARWQRVPAPLWRLGSRALAQLGRAGLAPGRLARQMSDLAGADDTAVTQNLLCWVREREHHDLCQPMGSLPLRRLFETSWERNLGRNTSRLERLSAHVTEANIRLTLPNSHLFKADLASMKEGLEIRVPLLDEDLIAFGLTLPSHLKADSRCSKKVLRALARRQLPSAVADKRKGGFAVPLDRWLDADFRTAVRETLLSSSSRLSDFFRPEAYRPILEAFCDGRAMGSISREGLFRRTLMLLSVHLAARRKPAQSTGRLSPAQIGPHVLTTS